MATLKGKQVITNVYLEPEVFLALKRLSERTGAPMAHYLRQGIDKVLLENGVKVRRRPKTVKVQ
jgi:predicted DNA-binding protein